MKSHVNPDLIPILTETADGMVLELPMLTEAVEDRIATPIPPISLTDEQCRQLAEQLFPQLETTLRDAIGSRSEARWEKAMQQVRSALPDIIRNTVRNPG
jgi:hypothetical protein